MKQYSIAIGADHRGYAAKQILLGQAEVDGIIIEWVDCGTDSDERTDYPIYAQRVCHRVQESETDFGVLVCGTGVGMAIAANRFFGIYAALVWNAEIARRSREEDKANVLVLPADYLEHDEIMHCLKAWLSAEFIESRYGKRIDMIDTLAKLSKR